jgi:diketogulonate reductase-like aldo/keto reductase
MKATSLASTITLNAAGVSMPLVGIGTFRCKGNVCAVAVSTALKAGVRLIDTAEGYKNGAAVAQGIADSGVPRGDVFIVTKVSKESMSADGVSRCVAAQAALFGGMLDLVLLHWPGTATPNPASKLHPAARIACWEQLQQHHAEGTVRSIGVSNFTVAHLGQLLADERCRVVPAVNQVEAHPFHMQRALRAFCGERGIVVQPYTSLGRSTEAPKVLYGHREPDHPRLVRDPRVLAVSERLSQPPEAVLLRWAIEHGMGVIPKAAQPEHVKANATVPFTFALMTKDLAELDALTAEDGSEDVVYAYAPSKVPA